MAEWHWTHGPWYVNEHGYTVDASGDEMDEVEIAKRYNTADRDARRYRALVEHFEEWGWGPWTDDAGPYLLDVDEPFHTLDDLADALIEREEKADG